MTTAIWASIGVYLTIGLFVTWFVFYQGKDMSLVEFNRKFFEETGNNASTYMFVLSVLFGVVAWPHTVARMLHVLLFDE